MIKITIERSGSQRSSHKKPGRSLPRRRIVLGLVAAVVLVGGVAWGVSHTFSAPERNYMAALKAEVVAFGDPAPSDEDALRIMNNVCDGLRGQSLGTSLSRDPEDLPKTMTRDEYVAASDEYCASRG